MFWQMADTKGELARGGWVRVISVPIDAARGLPAHAAPADAALVCVQGSIRFVHSGVQRDLHPGDGVVMRRGDMHAALPGSSGLAVLLLREESPQA